MVQAPEELATTTAEPIVATAEDVGKTPWQIFWRRFRRDRVALSGFWIIVGLVVLSFLAAPLIVKFGNHHPPNEQYQHLCWGVCPLDDTSVLPPFGRTTGDTAVFDAAGHNSLSVAVDGTGTATLQFQQSDDGRTWTPFKLTNVQTGDSTDTFVASGGKASATFKVSAPITIKKFRTHLVSFSSGSLSVRTTGDAPSKGAHFAINQDFGTPSGPSGHFWFGVTKGAQDVFSRVLYGLRVSLIVAFIATGISLAIGIVMGLIAGYYGGKIDTLISRFMDILLSFPLLLLALGISASCGGENGCAGGLLRPGLGLVIMIIAFANWPYIARIVRGQVLSVREKEFVEAARMMGAGDSRIIFREILPNLVAPIIVYTTLIIPTNILFEAALSFLGVGIKPPNPSLGQMISDAVSAFKEQPWNFFFPGLFLVTLVLAFNLLGDGLRDAFEPGRQS